MTTLKRPNDNSKVQKWNSKTQIHPFPSSRLQNSLNTICQNISQLFPFQSFTLSMQKLKKPISLFFRIHTSLNNHYLKIQSPTPPAKKKLICKSTCLNPPNSYTSNKENHWKMCHFEQKLSLFIPNLKKIALFSQKIKVFLASYSIFPYLCMRIYILYERARKANHSQRANLTRRIKRRENNIKN